MAKKSTQKFKYYERDLFVSVAYFWVISTGSSGEFHVVFKHFENLENLIWNILMKELHILWLKVSFFLKGVLSFYNNTV